MRSMNDVGRRAEPLVIEFNAFQQRGAGEDSERQWLPLSDLDDEAHRRRLLMDAARQVTGGGSR
jgi:hypothetical protein